MNSKRVDLDRLDWRILEALQANSRMSNTEIGKQIGLSQPAVTARIRRLKDRGVIEGFTAKINPRLAGRDIGAFIRIQTSHERVSDCVNIFDVMPEVLEATRVTGEDCFVVRVAFQNMEQLETVVDELAGFGPVKTSVILASYPPKAIRFIPE
jgi:Lrp/AsnC family leucine-responsive transcriptional regulator